MKNNQFPIGKYHAAPFSEEQKIKWINDIEFLPQDMEYAVQSFSAIQFDTPYRESGWTIRQLIHHVADSHMNAYIRFKLGLSENNPTIKPYDQDSWATMIDTYEQPINVSLTLLHALHKRWVSLLKNIKQDEWERTVVHPEHGKQMTLWFLLGMYAWHSRHHLAHITTLKENEDWS
jgi:hypothetical protein